MMLQSSIQLQQKESNGGEFKIFAKLFLISFDIFNLQRTTKTADMQRTEVKALH